MGLFEGLTILVTGANGFLGRHLLARLSRANTNLHAVSRSLPTETGGIQWWQGNVADLPWLRDVVGRVKPDIIYQLASASFGGKDSELVIETFENDLRTTVNTLVAAQDSGSRVIMTRSLDEPMAGAAPGSPYATAKAASGLYGRMFHQLYSVPVVMLRPFMTYGPGQKDHKIIPHFIQSLLQGHAPTLSSGNRRVDWIYVDDVISGFLSAATRPEAVGREIDLGSGSLVAVREVVEQIRELIPGAPAISFCSSASSENEQSRSADLATALETLDWKPETSLRRGLLDTIQWYRVRDTVRDGST